MKSKCTQTKSHLQGNADKKLQDHAGGGTISKSSPITILKTVFFAIALLTANLFFTQQSSAQTQTFNSSGTFTVPAGVTSVTVEAWGGGGKGGDRSFSTGTGGGGGGGAYSSSVVTVTPATGYTVTVGAGSTTTSAGGDSWFINTSTVLAKGGSSVSDNSSSGVVGGQASAGVGTTKYNGGTGGSGSSPNAGGGGSSAGTGAVGVSGGAPAGGIAPTGGGNGGAGRSGSSGNGTNGSTPGGGGGGAYRSSFGSDNGGNGANGRVIITWTVGTTYTSTGAGGPWNSASTWSPASVPPAASNVVIATGAPVTVNVNTATIANLTINSSLDAGTFTVSGNGTLTLAGTGTLVVGANNFPSGFTSTTLSPGSTVNYNGAAQTVSAQSYSNLTLSGSGIKTLTGITTVGGNLTLSGTASATTAASVNIGGNLDVGTGTSFTIGTSNTVVVTGTSTVTGTCTNNGTFTVGTALSGAGGLTNSGTGVLNIGGTSTITTLTATAGGNTVNYTGAAQTVKATPYDNLSLSGSGTKTLAAATVIGGNLTISGSAIANLSGTANTANTLYFGASQQTSGTWGATGSGATNINNTYFSGSGRLTVASGSCVAGTWTGATNTSWGTASNWCNGVVPTSSTNVIISSGGNQPVIGAPAVCNNLTINSGASLSITGTNTLTISGNWTNSGTFTPNSSTVIYNNTGAQTCAVVPYNNLTLSGSGTKTLGASTTVTGNLTMSGSAVASLSGTANTSNVLYFGAVQQVAGTWGATGSGAANINDTFFAGSGRLSVATSLAPSLDITAGITNHGSSCVGVPAAQQTYTITNTGGTATGVYVSSTSTQFVVSNLSSTTIAGNGGTATYVVTFTPGSAGVKSAEISVICTPPGNTPVLSELTGTGNIATAGLSSSDPDNIICEGDAVTFTATGGPSYQFFVNSVSQGPASATAIFITSTLTDGQIVTVTVANTNGCSATSTGITTTVNPLPIIAPITGIPSVSVGSTTTLGNPVGGGIWSSGTEAVATVNSSGEVLGISAGTSLIRYTVTNGNCSVFETLLITVSPVTGIEDLQSNGGLTLKNHPNPFTGNTTMRYTLPYDGQVTLSIRSLTGQVIKTFVNEMETEGEYTLNPEVGDLQSGVYFATLKLKGNGKELTRTIRIVKGK